MNEEQRRDLITKLRNWSNLLNKSGRNTKGQVKEEILVLIEELEKDSLIHSLYKDCKLIFRYKGQLYEGSLIDTERKGEILNIRVGIQNGVIFNITDRDLVKVKRKAS